MTFIFPPYLASHPWVAAMVERGEAVICATLPSAVPRAPVVEGPQEDAATGPDVLSRQSPVEADKVQRVYFHRIGSVHQEDHIDIPLGDDPKRHVADALIHRVHVINKPVEASPSDTSQGVSEAEERAAFNVWHRANGENTQGILWVDRLLWNCWKASAHKQGWDKDAALYRAAPDLLAALQFMLESEVHGWDLVPSHEKARAAIAKATGEQVMKQSNVQDEAAELDVGALVYRGNTVSFMYDRAKAYGDEIMRCWFVLKDAGLHPGRTDEVLHEVLRAVIAKAT